MGEGVTAPKSPSLIFNCQTYTSYLYSYSENELKAAEKPRIMQTSEKSPALNTIWV